MATQAQTNINAYLAEAQGAVERAKLAQQEAEAAIAAYVAQGGKVEDVVPQTKPEAETGKKVSRSAKDGKFVSAAKAKKSPSTTVTEKVKRSKK